MCATSSTRESGSEAPRVGFCRWSDRSDTMPNDVSCLELLAPATDPRLLEHRRRRELLRRRRLLRPHGQSEPDREHHGHERRLECGGNRLRPLRVHDSGGSPDPADLFHWGVLPTSVGVRLALIARGGGISRGMAHFSTSRRARREPMRPEAACHRQLSRIASWARLPPRVKSMY